MSLQTTKQIQPTVIRLSERYKPLPTQLQFHQSKAKFRAMIGGIGSGKSFCVSQEAFLTGLRYPGTTVLIGRMFYTELRDTTMKIFMDDVLPPELMAEHNKHEMRITLRPIGPKKLQTTFLFRALEDMNKVKSMNLGFFAVDEVNEITEEMFLELCRRLRNPFGPGRGCVAGEDEGRNWVYHRFHPAGNKHDPHLYEIFVAPTKENVHLPPGFIESQYKNMPPEMVERYLEPSFQLLGGAVYPEWDPSEHVIDPFPVPKNWPVYRVIDPGITNVTGALFYAIDPTGTYYFVDEFYQPGVTVRQAAREIRKTGKKYEDQIVYTLMDPAGFKKNREKYGRFWSLADEYNEQGIFCIPASNDVRSGINRVKQALHMKKLFVFRNCENLQEEFSDYGWRQWRGKMVDESRKEKPLKVRDHLMDCCRYALSDDSDGPEPERDLIDRWYFREEYPEPDWQVAGIPGA